jgi:hypothetical protein
VTADDCCGLAECLELASTHAVACCFTPASGATCSQSSDCCGITICDIGGTNTCVARQQGQTCLIDDDCADAYLCDATKHCN